MDFISVGVQNIIDGKGIAISITGMSIVFMALMIIALFIAVLPKIIPILNKIVPPHQGHHGVKPNIAVKKTEQLIKQEIEESSQADEVAIAIGYALYKKNR